MCINLENIRSDFNSDFLGDYKLLNFECFSVQVLLLSSKAKVSQLLKSVDVNNCNVCLRLQAGKQSYKRVLNDKYIIINRHHSIFKNNKLLVADKHFRKKDYEKIKDILLLAKIYNDSVVLCDGMTYPDGIKRHFYLPVLPKYYFSLIEQINSGACVNLFFKDNNIEISLLEKQIRSAIIVKSKNYIWIFNVYLELEKLLGRSYSLSKYPYINFSSYYNNDEFVFIIFARVVQKPLQYYNSSLEQIKVIPGAQELMGMFVVGNVLYYNNLTEYSVKSIYEQISYSHSSLTEIIKPLLYKLSDAFYLK